MDQGAPGIADNGVEVETHRRRAQDDQRLGELMVGAQAGDKARYARLLAACETLVRRAARRVGVQSDLIEDVVQETLITMHNARHTYDPSRSFSAWLSTIAQRRAIDALRRNGRHARREFHAPLDHERHPDPDAHASSSPELRTLNGAV